MLLLIVTDGKIRNVYLELRIHQSARGRVPPLSYVAMMRLSVCWVKGDFGIGILGCFFNFCNILIYPVDLKDGLSQKLP